MTRRILPSGSSTWGTAPSPPEEGLPEAAPLDRNDPHSGKSDGAGPLWQHRGMDRARRSEQHGPKLNPPADYTQATWGSKPDLGKGGSSRPSRTRVFRTTARIHIFASSTRPKRKKQRSLSSIVRSANTSGATKSTSRLLRASQHFLAIEIQVVRPKAARRISLCQ